VELGMPRAERSGDALCKLLAYAHDRAAGRQGTTKPAGAEPVNFGLLLRLKLW
jgi:hypothetical protein